MNLSTRRYVGLVTGLVGCSIALTAFAVADERERFFESEIRPLLEAHCLECHQGSEASGGLRLEYREGWSDAAVIVPGKPQSSRLLQVVQSDDPDERMPPTDAGGPLSPQQIQALEKWIADGAWDPRGAPPATLPASTGPKKRSRVFEFTDEDRTYWAFQPLRADDNQELLSIEQAAQRIDELLESRRSKFNGEDGGRILCRPPADPRTLVRRVVADLWGIVPTPEMVDGFVANPDEPTWKSLIDSLLASRRYGEHWGRHWLDWVRYAETNGYERDGPKPNAWRYRDYVIHAFASDKPYDQFIIEQLAGDEWSRDQGWTPLNQPERWRECIIATGFYRLHQWDDEPDDSTQAEFDDADDVVISIGTTFLGLTIGCARCHDHKFDPISQQDYYSLLSCLRGIDPYGLPKKGGGGRGTGRIQQFLVDAQTSSAWEAERQNKLAGLRDEFSKTEDPAKRLAIDAEIKSTQDAVPPFDSALAVSDRSDGSPETFVLHRGDIHSPKQKVAPEVPRIFCEQTDAPKLEWSPSVEGTASGRRLSLARWIASPKHPLTARVMVNRIWQRHFGLGIVPTTDDFGRTGLEPSNPELLDFLASQFIRSGWSVHHMHRVILATRAYRLSSSDAPNESTKLDPESRTVWSQRMRRLDAEAIRDSILQVAGTLTEKQGGPSVVPALSQEVRDAANPVSISQWQESPAEEQTCRSIYLITKRSLKVPFLETMDFANRSSPAGIRPVTTTAPQALLLLNDPWVGEQSAALVARLQAECSDGANASDIHVMVERLWKLAYQRSATDEEQEMAKRFLLFQSQSQGNSFVKEITDQAWISLGRAVLNSNEFLYID
jgi:hypothetical protein